MLQQTIKFAARFCVPVFAEDHFTLNHCEYQNSIDQTTSVFAWWRELNLRQDILGALYENERLALMEQYKYYALQKNILDAIMLLSLMWMCSVV